MLKIKRLNLKTAGLTILIFLLMFCSLEGILRIEIIQSYFDKYVPNYGSRHRQLEIQIARLEDYIEDNGHVDCIMFGSSLVWLGFNPDRFEEIVLNKTGQSVNCFNFGINSLPTGAAADLARILVSRYHPKLLIYGTSARDYAPDLRSEDMSAIVDTGWVQYQMGNNSPWVWFQNHSFIYRYAKILQLVIRFDTEGLRSAEQEIGISEADTSGFLPKTRPAEEVNFLHAKQDAERLFHPYKIYQENLEGLEQIMDLREFTRVLIVEMPISDRYYSHFENGRNDYERFVEAVVTITDEKGIQFIRSSSLQLIPEEGFWDISHMNLIGANIFTEWLAFQIVNDPTEGITE